MAIASVEARSNRKASPRKGATFAPARALYERAGFRICGPFAAYVEDPNSVYMTLPLG